MREIIFEDWQSGRKNPVEKSISAADPEISEEETAGGLERFLDFSVKACLFLIFFGLPLFFTGLSFQGAAFEKEIFFYALVLLGVIFWLAKSAYAGELKIKRTPLDIPIILFWLFSLASLIFSFDRWRSFWGAFGDPSRGFLNLTAMVLAYYLLVGNFSVRSFKWILGGILSSGILVVFWAIPAFMGMRIFPESWSGHLPVSFSGSVETLAIFCGFWLMAGMTVWLEIWKGELSGGKKALFSLPAGLLVLGTLFLLLALWSYVFWPGILIGTGIFLIFILGRVIRPAKNWTVFPMLVFLTILFFLMIGRLGIVKINLPLMADVPYKTSWEIAKKSLGERALAGYGPANYGYAFSKFFPEGFDNSGVRFLQGRGMFLETLSTLGIPGTVLFLILILTFLSVGFFMLSRGRRDDRVYSLGIFSAALGLLATVVSGKVESPVLIYGFLFLGFSLAVFFRENRTEEKFARLSLKASPRFALTSAFLYLLFFAGAAYLFIFMGRMYLADVHAAAAFREGKITEEKSAGEMFKAINLNGREKRYYSELGGIFLVLAKQEALKTGAERDLGKIENYLKSAMKVFAGMDYLAKNDAGAQESLALAYKEYSRYSRIYEGNDPLRLALEKYQRASELEPGNPVLATEIGQIKFQLAAEEKDEKKKSELAREAKDLFQRAIDLRKNYAPAYFNLALAQEALSDRDGAIFNMTKAVALQSGNIDYFFNLARLYQAGGKEEDLAAAEDLYKKILAVNPDEPSVLFNLGMVFESKGDFGPAVKNYERLLELPSVNAEETREKLRKMIENARSGIKNTPENLGMTEIEK